MRTKFFFLIGLLFLPIFSFAQEQVSDKKSNVVSDEYNRNGLTVVTIARGDSYDEMIERAATAIPEKFDLNNINANVIKINRKRSSELPALTTEDISGFLNKLDIGRDVVSFIFGRKSDGMMNDNLLRERGMYNATDQDVINARASQVGLNNLAEDYDKLIRSSYIMVFDDNDIKKTTTYNKKTGKSSTTYSAKATANVYRINFDLDELWNAWIYEDDNDAKKAEKIKAFENMPITLIPVGRVESSGSSGEGYQEAINQSFNDALFKLERQIDEWQVRVYVTSVKPIAAKIGKKESLGNGTRYRAYSYKENSKGDLVSVKRGYVRAYDVVDNRSVATGDSETSKFFQISGAQNIQPGWLLREQKDWKIGGAIDFTYFSGSGPTVGLNLDYMLRFFKGGHAAYALLDLGGTFNQNVGVCYSVAGGAGFQVRFARMFLLMPYAQLHAVVYGSNTDYYNLYVGAGAKFNVQIAYPWSVYVKVGAEACVLDVLGMGHNVAVGFGVRRDF